MKKLLLLIFITLLGHFANATTHIVVNINNSGAGSLRTAVQNSSAGDTVRLSTSLLGGGNTSILLDSAIEIPHSLTVIGAYNTMDTVFISGQNLHRVFHIDPVAFYTLIDSVRMDSLCIINAFSSSSGGAIRVEDVSNFSFSNSIILNSACTGYGGAIYWQTYDSIPNIEIHNSLFVNDSASLGGVLSSYFWNVSFSTGSSIQCYSTDFIHNNSVVFTNRVVNGTGNVLFEDCNFIENTCTGDFHKGSGSINQTVNYTFTNCLIEGNTDGFASFSYNATSTLAAIKQVNLELNSCNVINNENVGSGGVFHVQALGFSLEAHKTAFDSNYIHDIYNYGSVFYVSGSEGSSSLSGEQIEIELSDSVFIRGNGCDSGSFGVFVAKNAANSISLLMDDVFGDSNMGCVFFTNIVQISNCLFTNNSANYYNPSSNFDRGSVIGCDTVSIINSEFVGNKNYNWSGGSVGAYRIYLDGCLFENNYSKYQGGALASVSLFANNSVFKGNKCDENGGAIKVTGRSGSTIDNCIFRNDTAIGLSTNTLTGFGGAIFFEDTIQISHSIISSNSAERKGGGISGDCDYPSGHTCNQELTITNCSIDSNFASNQGGGVSFSGSTYSYGSGDINLIIDSSEIRWNHCDNLGTFGGGLSIKKNGTSSIQLHNSIVKFNEAETYGGIYVYDYGPYYTNIEGHSSITNSTISNNIGGGAKILSTLSTATISNLDASNNQGSGLAVKGGGMVSNSSFHNNQISGLEIGHVDMDSCSLIENGFWGLTVLNGGSIVNQDTKIKNSIFRLNKGGAEVYADSVLNSVFNSNDSLQGFLGTGKFIENCSFDSNTAGGLEVSRVDTFINSSISYNGGIGIDAFLNYGAGEMYFNKLTIENNTNMDTLYTYGSLNLGGSGGGINLRFTRKQKLTIDSCIISNNYSATNGGGLNATSSLFKPFLNDTTFGLVDISIKNSSIINNTSVFNGGGIYTVVIGQSTLLNYKYDLRNYIKLENSTISNNSSDMAGALYSITNIQASGSSATYAYDRSFLEVFNSTIYNNHADSIGGIVNFSTKSHGYIKAQGSIIAHNDGSDIKNGRPWGGFSQYPLISLGYNVFGSQEWGAIWSDQLDIDSTMLNLGALQNNGGFAPTCLPLPGSYALNNGNPNDFSDAQNGPISFNRDVGAAEGVGCDQIGQYIYEACDSVLIHEDSTWHHQSGTVVIQDTNQLGCQINQTYYLTVGVTPFSSDTVYACHDYLWQEGAMFLDSTGVYQKTFNSEAFCDSVAELVLYLSEDTVAYDTAEICSGHTYIWPVNGQTYTHGGIHQQNFTTSYGCDSTIYLNLIVTLLSVNHFAEICNGESYVWPINGQTYTQNGVFSQNFPTSNGCDSVHYLNLDVVTIGIDHFAEICNGESYVWPINGQTYTQSGVYQQNFSSSSGCDSILYLNLDVLTIDKSLYWSGSVLRYVAPYDSVYWVFCDSNYTLVPGEVTPNLIPDSNISYAAVVYRNGCVDTTECFVLGTTGDGFVDGKGSASYSIYPNPIKNTLRVENGCKCNYTLQLFDARGSLVFTESSNPSNSYSLANQASGVYTLRIKDEYGVETFKLVKQ